MRQYRCTREGINIAFELSTFRRSVQVTRALRVLWERRSDDIPIRQIGEHRAESPTAWPIIFPVITRGQALPISRFAVYARSFRTRFDVKRLSIALRRSFNLHSDDQSEFTCSYLSMILIN